MKILNSMEKEFLPYEIALAMKSIGFDEPCFGFYENKILKPTSYVSDFKNGTNHNVDFDNVFKLIPAPLYQQCWRWFREKYRLDGKPEYFLNDWYCFIINDMEGKDTSRRLFTEFPSHEEAELECLVKLIEIVKNK